MSDPKPTPLTDFYADNPLEAEAHLFGRKAHADRRGFLRGAGLAAFGAALGAAVPFHRNFPAGLFPMPWRRAVLLRGRMADHFE